MVRHASLFSQLVALFSRQRFYELVYRHSSERYAKGFSSWDQFVAMLFCQLAQAKSLREISGGLASALGKLRHLGVKSAPNKSTLSYANAHRPWQLFQDLFYETLHWCQQAAPGKIRKFRFKNKLLSLDSSTISLCLSLFAWAKFRRTKGAVKLHLLLDHDGYLHAHKHTGQHQRDGKSNDRACLKAKADKADAENNRHGLDQGFHKVIHGFVDDLGLVGDQMGLYSDGHVGAYACHFFSYVFFERKNIASLSHGNSQSNGIDPILAETRLRRIGIAVVDRGDVDQTHLFRTGVNRDILEVFIRTEFSGRLDNNLFFAGIDNARRR